MGKSLPSMICWICGNRRDAKLIVQGLPAVLFSNGIWSRHLQTLACGPHLVPRNKHSGCGAVEALPFCPTATVCCARWLQSCFPGQEAAKVALQQRGVKDSGCRAGQEGLALATPRMLILAVDGDLIYYNRKKPPRRNSHAGNHGVTHSLAKSPENKPGVGTPKHAT